MSKAKSPKSPKSPKPNPFGSAKPREEVLAKKGIDFHDIDERIQKKASVAHFTKEQEFRIQMLQNDLTQAEDALRQANEKELPEVTLVEAVEKKRRALNDLMNKYKKENEGKNENDFIQFDGPYATRHPRSKRFENHHHTPTTGYKKTLGHTLDPFASFRRNDKSNERQFRHNSK